MDADGTVYAWVVIEKVKDVRTECWTVLYVAVNACRCQQAEKDRI
jgi:hypothetical protein